MSLGREPPVVVHGNEWWGICGGERRSADSPSRSFQCAFNLVAVADPLSSSFSPLIHSNDSVSFNS